MIMLALVDGDYKFMWVDVGTPGATCDSAVFNASTLKESLETGTINFPLPEPLPGDNEDTPYFFVCLVCLALDGIVTLKFFQRANK